jgi:branched-chain amino acid transport system substrate-binding protein
LLKVVSVKPELVFIGVTQSHAAFAEQVGQTPGFPVAIGSTFSRPFFGFPATKGWYHTAILSGTTPSDEQEFNAKFGTKEMGFFAREYSNSTDIILQAIDRVLGEGKSLTGDSIKDAIFAIKTFKSGVADITFTSNTAVRPVEIYRHGESARELVKFDAKM